MGNCENETGNPVNLYIQECEICQKYAREEKQRACNPIEVPAERELFECDIVGPMPITEQGNKYIFTCIDMFTKDAVAIAVPDKRGNSIIEALK
jgi:hypothetical protein